MRRQANPFITIQSIFDVFSLWEYCQNQVKGMIIYFTYKYRGYAIVYTSRGYFIHLGKRRFQGVSSMGIAETFVDAMKGKEK